MGRRAVVPLADGRGTRGVEAARETRAHYERLLAAPATPAVPPAAPIRYQVMTSVPENWIPFVPVHVPGDIREIQLQRAAMPRILEGDPSPPERVRPRTTLLREGLDATPPEPYFVHEEEVPRAGVRVKQGYQRTRWRDGRVVVWLGARKQTGRGEGSSGLAFDRLVDLPAQLAADREGRLGSHTVASAKTVAQSFLMLTTVQPCGRGLLERLLGTGRVVELALGVVVQDEQPQRRRVRPAGVAQHRDVAVRVAAGEDRPPPDPAPDPHRLDRPVVEDVHLGARR